MARVLEPPKQEESTPSHGAKGQQTGAPLIALLSFSENLVCRVAQGVFRRLAVFRVFWGRFAETSSRQGSDAPQNGALLVALLSSLTMRKPLHALLATSAPRLTNL